MRFTWIFLFIFAIAQAEVYEVSNFRGGMNLEDSTDLAPNEALSIKNMILGGDNLVSRHGWGQWNGTAIDTVNEIENCFVYQPGASTYRMVIASENGFVYKTPTLAGVSNWSNVAFKVADTGYVDAETLFVPSDIWPRLKFNMGDSVYLKCKPSTAYTIDNSFSVNDTAIILNTSTGIADSGNVYFEIWATTLAPSLSQYKDKLYISGNYAGSAGGRFSYVYNDTDYCFLGVIDTGIVSDTIDVKDTSAVVFNEIAAWVRHGSNKVEAAQYMGNWPDWSDVDSGMIFECWEDYVCHNERYNFRWQSMIDSIWADTSIVLSDTTIKWFLNLEDLLPEYCEGQSGHRRRVNYAIKYDYFACGFGTYAIEDSGKNWNDINYADAFLQAMYIQPANSDTVYDIYCNSEDYVVINGKIDIGVRYYIYSMLPYYTLITSEEFTQFPYLDQIIFHNERLWATGNNYCKYMVGEGIWLNKRGDVNTVWYSDPAYPEYIKYNYNFAVGNNERLTCEFELRGDLYFASANAIWRQGTDVGDVEKVTNVGFSDKKAYAEGGNNIGYFANDDGIYRFNGVMADKISRAKGFNIEPFHDKYKKSRMVLGYKDDYLYVSYPDSDVTLVYNLNDNFVSYFDFGMNFIMTDWADKDTSIFLFGNPNYPGRIFYYPTAVYYDSLSTGSAVFVCEYISGNQSFGRYEEQKRISEIDWSMKGSGTTSFNTYTDFGTTVCDSSLSTTTGNYVYFGRFDNDCIGEYNQFKFSTNAGQSVILRGYKVIFTWEGKIYK